MKAALNTIILLVLFAAGWRFVKLALKLSARVREVTTMRELIPAAGSLSGIDINGHTALAETDGDGRLRHNGRLLLFVLRRQHLDEELRFWKMVLEDPRSGGLAQTLSSLQIWAVCDEGDLCRTDVPKYITVLGHLDPYEMRSVVKASEKHEAILYDDNALIKSMIATSGTPTAIRSQLEQDSK